MNCICCGVELKAQRKSKYCSRHECRLAYQRDRYQSLHEYVEIRCRICQKLLPNGKKDAKLGNYCKNHENARLVAWRKLHETDREADEVYDPYWPAHKRTPGYN